MRRLVSILFVLLMPLQSALAALDACCALDAEGRAAAACVDACHGGEAGGDPGSRTHQDCHPCHLGHAAIVAALPAMPLPARVELLSSVPAGAPAFRPPARPERPKWGAAVPA
ncbi:hypothetical protein [Pseudothauera rhizosphaerae]|uniref:Uncharacterized protein n=1 Tax=Pseudothauera rhizosphaerae TaxID=2565932 RepID=A0A4S4AGQ7_9RHOO|nr:hypothetical protein [Pseudothauera rhizosphaerae]THF58077.1 hypothetical protein E6O51_17200 [Pseudothauera rhizosphaerae]